MSKTKQRTLPRRGLFYVSSALSILVSILFFGRAASCHDDSTPGSSPAIESEWLPHDGASLDALVYLPRTRGAKKKPVTIFLHGMCDVPERECPAFAEAATKRGFLICPRAPNACTGGGAAWGRSSRVADVETLLERVRVRYGDRIDVRNATLAGFSQGAFVAADIAERAPAAFSRLLLIGAKISLNASTLRKNGFSAALLAAGAYDLSMPTLRAEARRVASAGFASRFSSLGNVGHRFAEDMAAWTEDAFDWLDGAAPRDLSKAPTETSRGQTERELR
jgi:predicted esterase